MLDLGDVPDFRSILHHTQQCMMEKYLVFFSTREMQALQLSLSSLEPPFNDCASKIKVEHSETNLKTDSADV